MGSMNYRLFGFIIILLVCLPWAARAASPLQFLDAGKETKAESAPATLPEPAALGANWWDYFATTGDELSQRVGKFMTRLDGLQAELPPDTLEAARPYMERLRTSLKALPEAKAQPSPGPPTPAVYAEGYTIQQLLDLSNRRRRAQNELDAEQNDVASAERTIRSANRRIDTLLAAYLDLPQTSPLRPVRGLEIMADRSAVALAEQQLRVRKASLLAREIRLQHLADELAVAAKHLKTDPEELARLNAEFEQAQTILKDSRERLNNAQARALAPVEDDMEGRATSLYRHQQAVRAAVIEALAQVRLTRFQAQRELIRLLLEGEEVMPAELVEQIADWNGQTAEIGAQAQLWTADSQRERDRAGEAVARGSAEGVEEPMYIKLLHQDRLSIAQETLVALERLDSELQQAGMLVQLTDAELAHQQGGLRDWQIRLERWLTMLRERTTGWINMSLFKLGGTPVTTLGLVRFAVILFIAWWISYLLRRAMRQLGERSGGANLAAMYTVGRLSHYMIVSIGFIIGLSSIGVDFTNFALVAGALSIGIGFGLQSIVNNFVSGLILLFERSLKVGDWVELASGVAGEVREINVRSTVINTNDNIDIVVPNSEFMNNQVINWTLAEGFCRIHLKFRVAYGSDKDLVRQACLEAAEKLPHTLTGVPGRNPGVWLVGFGDNGLEFELVVWVTPRAVKRPGAVNAAYMWEIESALQKYGVEVPLPQRDLRLRSGFRELVSAEEPPPPLETGKPRAAQVSR